MVFRRCESGGRVRPLAAEIFASTPVGEPGSLEIPEGQAPEQDLMNKKSPSPIRFLLTLLLLRALVLGPFAAYGQGQIVTIPDFALKRSLLLALGKPLNSEITVAELATLQTVTLTGYEDDDDYNNIVNLTGLEHAVELRSLTLGRRERVSDLSPIKGLTKLTVLRAPGNRIADLGPVAGLTELTVLDMDDNDRIESLAPVAGLTKLTELSAETNLLTDLEPVRGLVKLTVLDVDMNQIEDLAPLANLTGLVELDLDRNRISDLAPLGGLSNLMSLDLDGNEIVDLSPLSTLGQLRDLD